MQELALSVLVFFTSMALDYCHTNFVLAVERRAAYAAALWSVLQWCAGLVGFLVAVKVTLWVLPAEALGLALGTIISIKRNQDK